MRIRTGRVFFSSRQSRSCSPQCPTRGAGRSVHEPRSQAYARPHQGRQRVDTRPAAVDLRDPRATVQGDGPRRRVQAAPRGARPDGADRFDRERHRGARGTGGGKTVLIAGHLDTVFPEGTNVKVKREGTKMTRARHRRRLSRARGGALGRARISDGEAVDRRHRDLRRQRRRGRAGQPPRHAPPRSRASTRARSTTSSLSMALGLASRVAPSAAIAIASRTRVLAATATARSGCRVRSTR